jgi:hypothetical protein
LEIEIKLIKEEFEELFKEYPLYSQEHESDLLVVVQLYEQGADSLRIGQ